MVNMHMFFIRKVASENGLALPFTYVGKGDILNVRKSEDGSRDGGSDYF